MRLRDSAVIMTIGHSTRKATELLYLIEENGIDLLVDIRAIPMSRHNPQFNEERLKKFLKKHNISYKHMPELGGLRHTKKGSKNCGWKNASFRGFADYMQTPAFKKGINSLLTLHKKHKLVLMCAEALPWRCHRSLLADALIIRGIKVCHIVGKNSKKEHRMTSFAKVKGKNITYP